MSKDKRKKGCPNTNCQMHIKEVKQDAENEFCSKCASKLVFVCTKCFSEIEDKGAKHRICEICKAKQQEKREKAKEQAKGVAKIAVVPVGAVAKVAVDAFVGESKQVVVKKAAKIGKDAAKVVLKKL